MPIKLNSCRIYFFVLAICVSIIAFELNAFAFDYVFSTSKFSSTPTQPQQWESYVDTDTGITIRRITDIHKDYPDMSPGNGATIDYTRKTRLSSDGRYLIVYASGADENVYQIVDLLNKTIRPAPHISARVYNRNNSQDCQPEYRWDYTGNHPNRIYYRYGWEFYYGEVDYPDGQRMSPQYNVLVHNFRNDAAEFGSLASSIQNVYTDAEGDSSQDSRYWCWIVRLTDATKRWVIVYDKTADAIIGKLDIPSTGYGINFTDMSPDGSKALISWDEYRSSHEPYRGARAYNLDMANGTSEILCGASAHSGWAQGTDGSYKLIQANSCGGDFFRAQGIGGSISYKMMHQTYFADTNFLNGGGTNAQYLGYHVGRTYGEVNGWAIVNFYGSCSYWGCEQIVAVNLKDIADGIAPRVWRIASTQNMRGVNPPSPGGSTSPMISVSLDGTRIYFGSNWRGTDNYEVYEAQLPANWWDDLNNIVGNNNSGSPSNQPPVAVDDTTVTDMDTTITINVISNDSDADNDTLTVSSFSALSSSGGTVVNQDAIHLTYTPASGFIGTDTFTYTVTDGRDESNTATVMVTVNATAGSASSSNSGGTGDDSPNTSSCFISALFHP